MFHGQRAREQERGRERDGAAERVGEGEILFFILQNEYQQRKGEAIWKERKERTERELRKFPTALLVRPL